MSPGHPQPCGGYGDLLILSLEGEGFKLTVDTA